MKLCEPYAIATRKWPKSSYNPKHIVMQKKLPQDPERSTLPAPEMRLRLIGVRNMI